MTQDYFGYSSSTLDAHYTLANYVRYIYGTPTQTGTLSYFYAYNYGWASNEYARAAVYVSSTRVLVAQTDEIPGNDINNTLISSQFGPSSVTADVTYIIVIWGGVGPHDVWRQSLPATDGYWFAMKNYALSGNGDYATYLNPLDDQILNYSHNTTSKFIFFVTYDIGGASYTTFTTPVGNYLGWTWDTAKYDVDSSPRALDKSGTSWEWGTMISSTSYFYPSGSDTHWEWVSGSME